MLNIGLEWVLYDTHMNFLEITTPPTPPKDQVKLYAKDVAGVSTLCYKNDAGGEICLQASSGGTVTGSGVAGQVAFFTGPSSIGGDTDMTFSADTLTVTKAVIPTSLTLSYLTQGSVLFAGPGGLVTQDNPNFFWDDTNNRLGIGTNTPNVELDIASSVATLVRINSSLNTSFTQIGFFEGATARAFVEAINSNFGTASRRNFLELGSQTAGAGINFYTGATALAGIWQSDLTLDFKGQVKIEGGSPGVGKVLTDSDGTGLAVWATPSSSGGTVTSISAGTGITLTPNPITTTGSVAQSNTAVTPGTYGDSTHVGQFTVDQQGNLTFAQNVLIAAGGSFTTGMYLALPQIAYRI